jgi:hypothetical protein
MSIILFLVFVAACFALGWFHQQRPIAVRSFERMPAIEIEEITPAHERRSRAERRHVERRHAA